jgi:hypothetical protein
MVTLGCLLPIVVSRANFARESRTFWRVIRVLCAMALFSAVGDPRDRDRDRDPITENKSQRIERIERIERRPSLKVHHGQCLTSMAKHDNGGSQRVGRWLTRCFSSIIWSRKGSFYFR